MRDIARIPRILDTLHDKWVSSPDQRFGQLLINLGVISDDNEVWYREDLELERLLLKGEK